MDMDSSRRSFDRSRELGAKKPRLAADSDRTTPNGRAFLQASSAAPATGSISSRLRAAVSATERDSDDSSGGGGAYHPQHPHQELLSQYKTALSELTFNSKPIITNLTIIAGENQHVAKGIAATICSNILEVPSDQKLPSLYLLDSIVKNIGRDYIKYFAARLPEVFCKAYKQVDPSTHPGMRHLFGTWKGVFPLQSLQVIEKELGFGQAVNGSSSAAVISRPDSQSQRPAHSIHVNPKYLERQRLQQSSRAKGVTNDSTETTADGIGDMERLEGTTGISAARPWSNLPLKLHNVHRSQPEIETVSEKNSSTAYGDYKGGSDLSRASGLAMGRVSERTMELARDKSRYITGIGVTESISSQRNDLDIKHKLSGYTASRSANAGVRLKTAESTANRNNGVLSTDWKNSEEEEYMWDDMNLRLKNHSASGGLRKESWIPDDSEKLDFGNHLRKQHRVNNAGPKLEIDASIDSLSSEEKEYSIPGKKISSPWSMDEPYLVDGVGLSKSSSSSSPGPLEGSNLVEFSKTAHSLAKTGPLSLLGPSPSRGSSFGLGASAPTGTIGQQWASSRECSRQPPMHQLPVLPLYSGGFLEGNYTLGEQEQSVPPTDFSAVKFPGSLNTRVQNQINEESVNLPLHCIQPHNFPKLHGQNLQVSSATAHAIQSRHQIPHLQKMQLDASTLPEPSLTNQKLVVPQTSSIRGRPLAGNSSENSNVIPPDFPGNPNRSSLLEAVMKSGILSSTSVTPIQPKHNLKDPRKNSQLAVQPPLSTGPLPTKLTSSRTKVSSTPSSLHLLDKASASANPSQRKVERPPLPAGPAPPSSAAGSAPVSSVGNKTVDPISNLLSSLVAKGLISASKPKSAVISSPKKSVKPHSPSSGARTSTSMPVSTVTQATATLSSSVRDEASSLESQAKDSVAEPEPVTSEVESLIGFEFKSDVIREAHPLVVSSLFDELLHQCSICGLRLKFKERLDRHLEWHSSKIPESDSLCGGSRKWFLHSSAWVAGGHDSGNESSVLADVPEKAIDKDVQMVIADESQCICLLCGQLFEDFYSQERDQWMFKDAVYMTVPSGYSDSGAMKDTAGDGPIVHANCISESSACVLGLATEIKMEEEE